MRTDVAALYVDEKGPYPLLVAEWYDARRDARTYAGPWPVVAHPPCGPWGRLRHLSTHPEDRPLALAAVDQVRQFGGVLEHPAHSLLGSSAIGADLPLPGDPADDWGGRSIEVCQCDWGHVARKRTWLYIVGASLLPTAPEHREPTHWISGFRTSKKDSPKQYKKRGCAVPPGIKVCSSQQRRRTPPAFAEWLLEIAAHCHPLKRTDHAPIRQ